MGSYNTFHGGLLLSCLKDDALVAFLDMPLYLYSHLEPKEMVAYQVEYSVETQVADLIMASLQDGLPVCGWQYQLEQYLLSTPLQNFSVHNALPQLEVVEFTKDPPELG